MLFIPAFCVTIGFLIDVRVFYETIVGNLLLVGGVVATPIVAKWIAGVTTQKCLGRDEGLTMWALALPQVAATLAVALTAYAAKGRRLIDEPVLNSILVLVVVTSILGPVLTEVFGKRLAASRGVGDVEPLATVTVVVTAAGPQAAAGV